MKERQYHRAIIIMTYGPVMNGLQNLHDESNWRENKLKKYNYISNFSSFSYEQTATGRRPNSRALSCGGRSFTFQQKKSQLSQLADGTFQYVADLMSIGLCTVHFI